MDEWILNEIDEFPKRTLEKLKKTHLGLIKNVFDNLNRYFDALNKGTDPEQIKRTNSFVHNEKRGLVAIDQRPQKKGFQIRLYIYPKKETKTLYLISIGDKSTQPKDIKFSYKILKEISNGQTI